MLEVRCKSSTVPQRYIRPQGVTSPIFIKNVTRAGKGQINGPLTFLPGESFLFYENFAHTTQTLFGHCSLNY